MEMIQAGSLCSQSDELKFDYGLSTLYSMIENIFNNVKSFIKIRVFFVNTEKHVKPGAKMGAHDFTRFLPRSNPFARQLTSAREARPGSPRIGTIQAVAPLR